MKNGSTRTENCSKYYEMSRAYETRLQYVCKRRNEVTVCLVSDVVQYGVKYQVHLGVSVGFTILGTEMPMASNWCHL